MAEKRGLGRGLSALIGDALPEDQPAGQAAASRADRAVPIEKVVPNPDQPRKSFDELDLEDLSNSIREKGILQPLLVRDIGGGQYQIIAGERRWRAAQMAKLHEVPVLVRDYSDSEVLEIAIIENIQRADLNSIEEARGYARLMEEFGHTQEALAKALGKSRSHIANTLRLLTLPEAVQFYLENGRLTAGHARALITADNSTELAHKIVKNGMSVREAEKLAKAGAATAEKNAKPAPRMEKDADTIALENDLSATIGMRVEIRQNASGESGQMVLHYPDLERLDSLCQVFSNLDRMAR